MNILLLIISISILFQLLAAAYALWLIKLTGLRYSWFFISTALFFMIIRRLYSLYNILTSQMQCVEFFNESIGLVLSAFMLIGIYGIASIFKERNQAEKLVKNLLNEKETILRETHHRIKNNMSTIYGLLFLQAEDIENSETKNILMDAAGRVQSMVQLYNTLYRSENKNALSIKEYLPSLINEIVSIFPQKASVKFEIDDIIIGVKVLSPLGIIINELITNSMKYAFTGRSDGVITVKAHMMEDRVLLTYQDNGAGIPESVTFENTSGFGMQLISMLVQQIKGSIAIERNEGTKFIIEFDG